MKMLIVDDDPDFRALLVSAAPARVEALACASSREAVAFLEGPRKEEIGLAVIDLHLEAFLEATPEAEGLALARWICRAGRTMPTVLISSDPGLREPQVERELGILGFLRKPLRLDRFYHFVEAFEDLFGDRAPDRGNAARSDGGA